MLYVILMTLFIGCNQVDVDSDTIIAKTVDVASDNFEKDIASYKVSEFWPSWSMPIGIPKSSSNLESVGDISYIPDNLSDYDLNTAWIPKNTTNWGIGESFEFIFNFPENTSYADAYQFYGICNLFNGYCKSLETWEANSRVKKLKVFYNDKFVCFVKLQDTWHLQYFDISKYFVNKVDKKYLDAKYEIVEGDRLRFEIIEVYKGSKYKDTAISEFLCEGAGN